jgi:hypothetical protein
MMGTVAGVGFSEHRNPAQAGKDAATSAMTQAGIDHQPDFVLVFATVGYHQARLIQAIRQVTGEAPLSGCSGEGVITRDLAAESNFGVAVMVIASDEIRFDNVYVTGLEEDASLAGERLAAEVALVAATDKQACFLFADGLVFNFDPFLEAFERKLAAPLPLFGGLAADNWAAQQTYQYHNDLVFSGGVAAVVMSGQGKFTWGINHGCVPVGTSHSVTRSRGNVIHEIDGVPALEVLKDYFEEDWASQWSKTSLNLCLGLPAPDEIQGEYGKFIIRYMPTKDDAQGSVTIQSEVAEGTDVWIARRDKELIRAGVSAIAAHINKTLDGNTPKFILQFECVGRGKVVFSEQEKRELIRSLQQEIGTEVPWLGVYTYGEIGPIRQTNSFHNFTTVLVAVY